MTKVIVKKDSKHKWRWSLKAVNGRIIGASSQGYARRRDCIKNVHDVCDALDEIITTPGSLS